MTNISTVYNCLPSGRYTGICFLASLSTGLTMESFLLYGGGLTTVNAMNCHVSNSFLFNHSARIIIKLKMIIIITFVSNSHLTIIFIINIYFFNRNEMYELFLCINHSDFLMRNCYFKRLFPFLNTMIKYY